jgi:hypothetical protein
MKALSALAALLLAGTLHAQSPGEISFWESVRNSREPAELRAYLSQYPNGTFKALAESRLAALERAAPPARPAAPAVASTPPKVASTAPASVTSATRMPQDGDSWTYRLSYPRLRGQWGQPDRPPAIHVVTIGEAKEGRIVDLLAVDGGTQAPTSHSSEAYLAPQGVSVFSPYLIAFRDLPPVGSLGSITRLDAPCSGQYSCRASARVIGRERISVPAGQFNAVKILVEQQWTPFNVVSTLGSAGADMTGGRTLIAWYSPQVKRVVKYSSRLVAGNIPPMDANFDLELVSYQVK